MASPQTLNLNGTVTDTWTSATGEADIVEAISGADDTGYGTGTEDEVAEFAVDTDSEVVDSDTVTNVTINVRLRDVGSAGNLFADVSLVVDGTPLTAVRTAALSSSFSNSGALNHSSWNADKTAAQMDSLEVRVVPVQSGMPGTNFCTIDCADIVVTWTTSGPVFDQKKFRFRDDDAGEVAPPTGAEWLAAENVNIEIVPDVNFRVRFLVQETGNVSGTDSFQLQYSHNGGTYTDVNASSSVVRSSASPNVADGLDLTEQMAGDQSFITDNNGFDEVNGLAGSTVFTGNDDAEYEYCIQIRSADTKYADKIELQLVDAAGDDLDNYETIATCFVDAAAVVLRQVEGFALSLSTTQTSNTKTLDTTLLDLDKAFLVFGYRCDNNTASPVQCRAEITNTTTVTLERFANGSTAIDAYCYVVEFTDGVRVERGLVLDTEIEGGTAGEFEVALSNINNLAKTFHFTSFDRTVTHLSFGKDDFYATRVFDDGGVITFRVQTNSLVNSDADLHYEVVQYADCKVQRGLKTDMTATTTAITDVLSPAVDVDKSFVQVGGWRGPSEGLTDMGEVCLRARHTINSVSGDEITIDRDHHNDVAIDEIPWEVVEFTNDVTVQEVLESFVDTDGQEDATITAISDLNKAAAFASVGNYGASWGKTDFATDDNPGTALFTAELTTTTNLQTKRNFTSGLSTVVFYVVDFGATGGTGVNITVPAPRAFNLADQVPIVGTGAKVDTPTPKTYNLAKQAVIVGTGAKIDAPAPRAFNLTGFDPTIETGVNIVTPSPRVYNLTKLLPTIETGVNVITPSPKTYNLNGQLPIVGTGAKVDTPVPRAYTLTGFDPTIDIGVNVINPIRAFNLTKLAPVAGTSVLVTTPTPRAFNLARFIPTIDTGGAVNVIVPVTRAFELSGQLPIVGTGVIVANPLRTFNLAKQLPIVGTGVIVAAPVPRVFNLTGQLPSIGTGLIVVTPLRSFTLTKIAPLVAAGANVITPLRAFNLAGLAPVAGTSVNVINGIRAFNLAGQLPVINIGVNVISPLRAFNLADQLPIVGTGALVASGLRAFNLASFLPVITTAEGVDVIIPVTRAFNLADQLPIVGTGALVANPLGTFNLTKQTPIVGTGVELETPLGSFELTKLTPTVGTSVLVITPLGTFELTDIAPAVASGAGIIVPAPRVFNLAGQLPIIGTGVNITAPTPRAFNLTDLVPLVATGVAVLVPTPKSFTLNNFAPIVSSGVGIVVPLRAYELFSELLPVIGAGTVVDVPAPRAFNLAHFAPTLSFIHEIIVPLRTFELTSFDIDILTNRPLFVAEGANNIDLTPPFEDINQIRYLFKNFAILRNILEDGTDGQFTTSDGKTALVRGGIIIDLF